MSFSNPSNLPDVYFYPVKTLLQHMNFENPYFLGNHSMHQITPTFLCLHGCVSTFLFIPVIFPARHALWPPVLKENAPLISKPCPSVANAAISLFQLTELAHDSTHLSKHTNDHRPVKSMGTNLIPLPLPAPPAALYRDNFTPPLRRQLQAILTPRSKQLDRCKSR